MNSTIRDLIENGYKIPLITSPPHATFKNNLSAVRNAIFVDSSIGDLLATGRIKEVYGKPHVVNPLTVSEVGDKKRLILDLSHVNPHVFKNNIKFEDWKIMLQYVHKGDFLFKFDIKQGYHYIDIFDIKQGYHHIDI